MKIRCFFLGCCWDAGVEYPLGSELVRHHVCRHCGSHRVVSV